MSFETDLGKKITVDISLPVFNEEKILEKSVIKLNEFINLRDLKKYKIKIIIVDNASTDSTAQIAKRLASQYNSVAYTFLPKKGRGRALRTSWLKSKAKIVTYMDIDLSADLFFLKSLLDAITNGESDISIGSRLVKGAKVQGRTWLREVMSRSYNLLIQLFFQVSFKDAQCGFKAIAKRVFARIEPLIKNQNWFFDSELLIIADKLGMKIAEIPITWKDDPSSTVKIAKTAKEDLQGLWRLLKTKPWKHV